MQNYLVMIRTNDRYPFLVIGKVAEGPDSNDVVTLSEPIDTPDGLSYIVPRDQVYALNPELLSQVNPLVVRAQDALAIAEHLLELHGTRPEFDLLPKPAEVASC